MAEGSGRLNIVAMLAAAASLASAGVSWYFSRQELAQQTLESDRGYQVQVYQHVRETLQEDKPSPAQVNAACALVLTLPNNSELKRRLAQILVEEAVRLQASTGVVHCSAIEELRETLADESVGGDEGETQVLTEAAAPPEAMEEAVASAPATAEATPAPADAAPAPAPAAQPSAVARSRVVESAPPATIPRDVLAGAVQITPDLAIRQMRINPVGWDIDVFYCAGGDEAANRARATKAAQALAAASDAQTEIASGLRLGRIRLRELTTDVNARPGYRIMGDIIRGEASERDEAQAIAANLAGAGAGDLRIDTVASRTPWYLSAFFCPAGKS